MSQAKIAKKLDTPEKIAPLFYYMRLQTWIESTGESPETISERAGLSRMTLRRVLQRQSRISAATLEALAETYGLSPTWVVTGKGPMTSRSLRET